MNVSVYSSGSEDQLLSGDDFGIDTDNQSLGNSIHDVGVSRFANPNNEPFLDSHVGL